MNRLKLWFNTPTPLGWFVIITLLIMIAILSLGLRGHFNGLDERRWCEQQVQKWGQDSPIRCLEMVK